MVKHDRVFTQLRFGMASKKEDNWIRRFTVTDPFRHHKGFTLYKITSFVSSHWSLPSLFDLSVKVLGLIAYLASFSNKPIYSKFFIYSVI